MVGKNNNSKKRNGRNGSNHHAIALSLVERAFYNNLDVLIDDNTMELMKDPKVRDWARRMTIEGFELMLSIMKEKWRI